MRSKAMTGYGSLVVSVNCCLETAIAGRGRVTEKTIVTNNLSLIARRPLPDVGQVQP